VALPIGQAAVQHGDRVAEQTAVLVDEQDAAGGVAVEAALAGPAPGFRIVAAA